MKKSSLFLIFGAAAVIFAIFNGCEFREFSKSDWFVLSLAAAFIVCITSTVFRIARKKGEDNPEDVPVFAYYTNSLTHPLDLQFAQRYFKTFAHAHKYYKYTQAKMHVDSAFKKVSFVSPEHLDERRAYMMKEYDELLARIYGIINDIEDTFAQGDWEDITPELLQELDQLVAMVNYHDALLERCRNLGICTQRQ